MQLFNLQNTLNQKWFPKKVPVVGTYGFFGMILAGTEETDGHVIVIFQVKISQTVKQSGGNIAERIALPICNVPTTAGQDLR